MYKTYSAATGVTLRARWSFYDDYGYGSSQSSNPRICSSQSSLYSITTNPRLLYYGYLLKRHSRLFQLEPSRSLLLPRRTIRVRVCDGGFDESIGLLSECERCCCRCRCCKGVGFGLDDGDLKKSSKNGGSWAGFERKRVVEESWAGDFEDSSRNERSWLSSNRGSAKDSGFEDDYECREFLGGVCKKVVRDAQKYEDDKNYSNNSRNENNRKVFVRRDRDDKGNAASRRDAGSEARANSKSVKNSSFSGDFDDRGVERRQVIGESSSGAWKKGYGGVDRVDERENVVREVRRHEDEENFSRNLRIETNKKDFDRRRRDKEENVISTNKKDFDRRRRDKEENVISWRDSRREAREEYGHVELEGSRKQLGSRTENSYDRNRFKDVNIDERIASDLQTGEGDVRDRYSEYGNGSNTRNVDSGEISTSIVKRQNEIDERVAGQVDLKMSSLRSSAVKRVSNLQRRFEEERVNNSVQVARVERTQSDRRVADKIDVNKQYGNRASDSGIGASYTRNSNSSKRYLEIRKDADMASSGQKHVEEEIINVREDGCSSVENSVQVRRDERTHVNQQSTNKMELNKQYENQTNSSRIHASDTKRASKLKSSLGIRADDREEHSSSVRDNSRVDSELDSSGTEFKSSSNERLSSLQEVSTVRTESQQETSSSMMVRDKKDNRQRSSEIRGSSQSTKTQVGASGSLHGGSSSEYHVRDDGLESASRLDESSAMYVAEFVDKLRQETSVSVDYKRAHQETTVVELGVDVDPRRYKEKNIEDSGRQSSSRSAIKGPSDEMWETSKMEETGGEPLAEEVVDSEESPTVTSENANIRRSHRSLWAYIADIMKTGLGRRARNNNSPQKSGTRSSSNESVSSEAWFSGQEPEEGDDETQKKKQDVEQCQVCLSTDVSRADEIELSHGAMSRQGVLSSETTPSSLVEMGNDHVRRSDSPKSEEAFDGPKVTKTRGIHGELRKRNGSPKESMLTTPVDIMRGDSSSKGEGSRGETGQRLALPGGDQSSVLSEIMVPPSIPEIGNAQMHGSELPKLEEITEIGGTEGGDGELKRRKLQRSKQVLAEQFEGWEEAYKRETEQRKTDELFMREALLEAKNAADKWEVPVGAVLVQNGKIIARGCNMVEELRDSTAHAEMICIREASNLLRTWRLAETTLYVTLEPCAMCAGAILQARIDTVVWGAPNKLLGADGSWIRLFPIGDGGSSSTLSPSTTQDAGPVHPFHPKITIRRGILPTECSDAMQRFFQLRRKTNNKKQEQPSPPPPCLPISNQPMKLFTRMHDIFCMMFCL